MRDSASDRMPVKGVCSESLSEMGTSGSKGSPGKKLPIPSNIPSDSPLGAMLDNWENNSWTKSLDRATMVQYCTFIWTKGPIKPNNLFWPQYGSYED